MFWCRGPGIKPGKCSSRRIRSNSATRLSYVKATAMPKVYFHIKRLVATTACLVGAAVLGWRTVAHPPPTKGQLAVIQGVVRNVTTVTRAPSNATHPLVHLEGE